MRWVPSCEELGYRLLRVKDCSGCYLHYLFLSPAVLIQLECAYKTPVVLLKWFGCSKSGARSEYLTPLGLVPMLKAHRTHSEKKGAERTLFSDHGKATGRWEDWGTFIPLDYGTEGLSWNINVTFCGPINSRKQRICWLNRIYLKREIGRALNGYEIRQGRLY